MGTRKADGFTYPRRSAEAMPYWDGCLRDELRFQRCRNCSEPVFHPRALCPYCLSVDLDWQVSNGRGAIYSFTLQHIPLHRERPGKLPRVLGIVALDEGFHMFTEIRLPDAVEPRVGMPVEVFFDHVSETLALPKFKPI